MSNNDFLKDFPNGRGLSYVKISGGLPHDISLDKLYSLLSGCLPILKINLRPFLRRFKTDFSGI